MYIAFLPKMIYFPLSAILLFLPGSKFYTQKHKWSYRILVILVMAVPFLRLLLPIIATAGGSLGTGDIRGGEDVNATEQLRVLLCSPWNTINLFLRHLKRYLNPSVTGEMYISCMGYLGKTLVRTNTILMAMLIGSIICQENVEVRYPWWTRIGVGCIYVVIGIGVSLAMYVYFTPLHAKSINGAQGRYLIPAIFPLLYVCTRSCCLAKIFENSKLKYIFQKKYIAIGIVLFFSFAALIQLWRGCLKWYI